MPAASPGSPIPACSPGSPMVACSPGSPMVACSPGSPIVACSSGSPMVACSPGSPILARSPGSPIPAFSPGSPMVACSPGSPMVACSPGSPIVACSSGSRSWPARRGPRWWLPHSYPYIRQPGKPCQPPPLKARGIQGPWGDKHGVRVRSKRSNKASRWRRVSNGTLAWFSPFQSVMAGCIGSLFSLTQSVGSESEAVVDSLGGLANSRVRVVLRGDLQRLKCRRRVRTDDAQPLHRR